MALFPSSLSDFLSVPLYYNLLDSKTIRALYSLRDQFEHYKGIEIKFTNCDNQLTSIENILSLDIHIQSHHDVTNMCLYFQNDVFKNRVKISCENKPITKDADFVVCPTRNCKELYDLILSKDPDFSIKILMFKDDGSPNESIVLLIEKDKYKYSDIDTLETITKKVPCGNGYGDYVCTLSLDMKSLSGELLRIGMLIGSIQASVKDFDQIIS